MSSTIRANLTDSIAVVETFAGVFVSANDNTVSFALSDTQSLTASTTVPVTLHSEGELALSSGTGTFDLTALPGKTAGETVNGTGLKVQMAKFRNKSTNANAITIAKGASTGYTMIGSAWTVTLQPGQWICVFGDDATPDISGSVKLIDVTGTGAQIVEYMIVMG